MAWLGALCATGLIVMIFVDVFQAMILPRRVRHRFRLSFIFYRIAWQICRWHALRIPLGRRHYTLLSIFGPLSLFVLMIVWAVGLIVGFGLLYWSLDMDLVTSSGAADKRFATYLYFSGTTFFTLGYGDLVPAGNGDRALSVAEAGIGFGFLAVVISYLPVLYQSFSRREITISLLDARAGSPPSAGELLRRLADVRSLSSVAPLLAEWERWAAELLESHLSFPVLRFYRSQHDNQSWVATLTMILDTSAFLIANVDGADTYQARLTFAMARHAAVDLVLVSQTPPGPVEVDRLPQADAIALREILRQSGLAVRDEATACKTVAELRGLYEPFVNSLATFLLFTLPPFVPATKPVDNWQTSPGMVPSRGLSDLQAARARDEHAF